MPRDSQSVRDSVWLLSFSSSLVQMQKIDGDGPLWAESRSLLRSQDSLIHPTKQTLHSPDALYRINSIAYSGLNRVSSTRGHYAG